MKLKTFWNADKVLSISALVISVATLLALIYQVKLSRDQTELVRKQQYASVLPYLDIMQQNRNAESFDLSITNNGVGPAFIKNVSIQYEDNLYEGDPQMFYMNVISKIDTMEFYWANISPGRAIPAGESISLIGVNASQEDADKLRKWFGWQQVIIRVVYSSVYDQSWEVVGLNGNPKPLNNLSNDE